MPGSVIAAKQKIGSLITEEWAEGAGKVTLRDGTGDQAVWCCAHGPWVTWVGESGKARTVPADAVIGIAWD